MTPEGDLAGADGIVVPIGSVAVLATQCDQLPHPQVGFINAHVPAADSRLITLAEVVMHIGSDTLGGVVGDADANVSVLHVHFLPFCSLLGQLYLIIL